MRKFLHITVYAFLVSSLWSLISVFAHAQEFSLTNTQIGIHQESTITLSLEIDEPINALSGKVTISSDVFRVESVRDNSSHISFWVEEPVVTDNEIAFSGVMPGGAVGEIVLFNILGEGQQLGEARFTLTDMKLFKNDGEGIGETLSEQSLSFTITEKASEPISLVEDSTPPEVFQIELGQDKDVFEGKYFISFKSSDKGSGIAYYEVQEQRFGEIEENAWERTESPYVLKDQWQTSVISVKAVDHEGNIQITSYTPAQRPLRLWGMGIVGILLVFIVGYVRQRVRARRILSKERH